MSSPSSFSRAHPDACFVLAFADSSLHDRHFHRRLIAQTKGEVISNSTTLRTVHNSFARSDPFSIDPSMSSSSEKEDAYHFVTYLPVAGSLYELDGLQSAPRRHGAVEEGGQKWMEEARKVVRERIESYPIGAVRTRFRPFFESCFGRKADMSSNVFPTYLEQLHFSLLALTVDPMPKLQRDLEKAKASGNEQAASMAAERVEDEDRKRKKWAVSRPLPHPPQCATIHH
jgi:ubiquitin carboxyl-terminal hydrolase L5